MIDTIFSFLSKNEKFARFSEEPFVVLGWRGCIPDTDFVLMSRSKNYDNWREFHIFLSYLMGVCAMHWTSVDGEEIEKRQQEIIPARLEVNLKLAIDKPLDHDTSHMR